MPIYEAQYKPLFELLSDASQDARLLIPDLQRPYVWSPQQVLMLVDSLLRGWPFGTLLLWNLGAVSQDEHMIPSRAFWSVVDRSDRGSSQIFMSAGHPNEFLMVLDGQQRVQSLLLAFGCEGAGLQLLDKDWKEALEGKSPYAGPNVRKHWTRGSLYLDLGELRKQLDGNPDEPDLLPDPDYLNLLVWANSGQNGTQNTIPIRPENRYNYPLPRVMKDKEGGPYILLARLWACAAKALNQPNAQLRELAQQLLTDHGVDDECRSALWRALRTFIGRLQVAQTQRVEFLRLNRFAQSGFATQEEYNNAIVNIFTRLNAGGRTLTREEITFAWIKVSWGATDSIHGSAIKAIESLRSALNALDNNLRLETDAVVRMLSTSWSVFERDGAPVRDRDLLDGKTVRAMAAWLKASWDTLHLGLVGVARRLVELELRFNVHYRSVNALTLLANWRLTYDLWALKHGLGSQARDVLLANADRALKQHAEHWMILSQWSGRWARGTDAAVANYMKRLADLYKHATTLSDENTFHIRMKDELRAWLRELQPDALDFVNTLKAEDRQTVGMYRVPLTLWQRQDNARQEAASQALVAVSTRKVPDIEVDHILPWSVWDKLTTGASEQELRDWGNSIGNCVLLTKTFNISKGTKTLDEWLAELQGLEHFDAPRWKRALCIPEEMAQFRQAADNGAPQKLAKLIQDRENLIKAGLREYVESCTR
jgi:hypothetical protein